MMNEKIQEENLLLAEKIQRIYHRDNKAVKTSRQFYKSTHQKRLSSS